MIDFSLDQSTTATGLCLWVDGRPVGIETIRPPDGLTERAKTRELTTAILYRIWELANTYPGGIGKIVLEDFERYSPRARVDSLRKLGWFSGYLHRALEDRFPGARVIRISKGTAPKKEALWLAKSFKLDRNQKNHGKQHSKDALDSLHIGLCAGLLKDGGISK